MSTSKTEKGQIYGSAGAPPRCVCSNLSPTGASGERHWPWEGREKGLFLKPVPSLESDSGKLAPLPRTQLGLKGTSPQLTKPGMGYSWPGKMPPPSWCSLQTPSPGSLPWFPQKGQAHLCILKTCFFRRPSLEGRAPISFILQRLAQCLMHKVSVALP